AGANPTVSTYASGLDFDGLTFGSDGTLWVAHAAGSSGNTIARLDGTSAAHPGHITEVAAVPNADGVALSAAGTVGGRPNFLVVNQQDGSVTRVELDDPGHPTTTLMTGGSRGDLTAVGPDGCLYATQTSAVLKLTNADGTCTTAAQAPTGTGGQQGLGGLAPSGVPVTGSGSSSRLPRCTGTRTIHVRVPHAARLSVARIYRGHRLVKRVTGRAVRRAVALKRVPRGGFSLTFSGRTKSGRGVVYHRTVKHARGCR
ncbi:MAG: hypothetical protein JWM71_1309, partial [Solirubrobacteraceae bacterium]|nr:hypothetical protein [Solirubrobacteraceae bacterium]